MLWPHQSWGRPRWQTDGTPQLGVVLEGLAHRGHPRARHGQSDVHRTWCAWYRRGGVLVVTCSAGAAAAGCTVCMYSYTCEVMHVHCCRNWKNIGGIFDGQKARTCTRPQRRALNEPAGSDRPPAGVALGEIASHTNATWTGGFKNRLTAWFAIWKL